VASLTPRHKGLTLNYLPTSLRRNLPNELVALNGAHHSCFELHKGLQGLTLLLRFGGLLHEEWRARSGRALPEGGSKRYSRCGVFGVAPNAPKPDETPSRMRGKEMRR